MSLKILVDLEAIALDTIQGIRQFALQSKMKFGAEDSVTHIYTVPWWTSDIDGDYVSHFISSLIPPREVAGILADLNPAVLSLYPTNLISLLKFRDYWKGNNLRLIVTHSEQSTSIARKEWAAALGVSVLDEYSSEEATRIALELPCGHYHACDDTVILEVLDPKTMLPQDPGKPGLVVITNLLNRAMPFIRYIQGDMATLPPKSECPIQWTAVENIDGRVNDAFLKKDGGIVPAGTLLDTTYRMMFDSGINLRQFELHQTDYDQTILYLPTDIGSNERREVQTRLSKLLETTMEQPVVVQVSAEMPTPSVNGAKRRPIKRTFGPKL